MAIKLHRCGWMWFKVDGHPCWRVQKALDETGTEYEVVQHPTVGRGRRTELEAMTGQNRLPALEFEDGRILREESKDMAARIREGRLDESGTAGAAGTATAGSS